MMVLHIYVFGARAHGGRVGEVDRAAVILEQSTSDRLKLSNRFLELLIERGS